VPRGLARLDAAGDLIAPENSSSFSVSVVLPASGWEMMANVRLRLTSLSSTVDGGAVDMGRRRRDEACGS
jgi:hypothetical protein